ncbi:hypothetical protein AZE42_07898 [Rhizopogon vesiculosus]|uniref:Uncharacterized protein n=1 Tax=Rhizopogon vesiculosus TaxID=180088 RepID=A0A1J8R741_9AGAM|nr:hypothetical protein AZE42_07898 [Rhizopogon vesiculosus]
MVLSGSIHCSGERRKFSASSTPLAPCSGSSPGVFLVPWDGRPYCARPLRIHLSK